YASAAAAASRYVGFCAKLAAIGASTIASSYFGIARGMNPLLAVFCGVVLESCFLWAYLALVKATERGDVSEIWTWRIATVAFGLFIAAVSVETVGTLAQIRIPLLAALADAGAVLYVSAVGLAMVLTIAAHIVTSATARAKQADGIRGTRTDLAEVRAALPGAEPVPTAQQSKPTEREALPEVVLNGHGGHDPKGA
ncbi:MAG: hypothetical protein RMN25_14780, partial [Anaerolineae bacterium]|nr:hypothetical protein [Thermoflexales bacterium]MDW8409037.1 hypothetical protein [Anaerolineae bacterium]